MITQEQINKLKFGDPLIVQGRFSGTLIDGDVIVSIKMNASGKEVCGQAFCHPSTLSLPSENGTEVPTPKHDPCRLFKKSDKARMVAWNGRVPMTFGDGFEEGERPPVTPEVIVVENEGESMFGLVKIQAEDGGQLGYTCPCYLELVTPVEEREPYYVDYITPDDDEDLDDAPRWCVKYRNGDDIVRVFYKNPFEAPEKTSAAAEAECKRLNDEWQTKVCRSDEGKEER